MRGLSTGGGRFVWSSSGHQASRFFNFSSLEHISGKDLPIGIADGYIFVLDQHLAFSYGDDFVNGDDERLVYSEEVVRKQSLNSLDGCDRNYRITGSRMNLHVVLVTFDVVDLIKRYFYDTMF